MPIVASLLLSLTDFDIYAVADLANLRFVGLRNYLRVFANPTFWTALGNTAYFVALGAPLGVATSLVRGEDLNPLSWLATALLATLAAAAGGLLARVERAPNTEGDE